MSAPGTEPSGDGRGGLARLHLWQIQGVRDVVLVALVIAVVYMGYALRSVTVPLLVAFGLAYLVEPVVQGLCRRFGLSRTAAVGALMATAGVALVAVLAVMVPVVVGQSSSFVTSLREGRFNAAISRAEQLVPEAYRGQLMRRLREAGLELDLEDERVLREIALFADRCDISEELTRLRSHLEQFAHLLKSEAEIGRKAEFILQEIGREVNTIGSKANDLVISRAVIELKNELERVREQMANVE